MNTKSHCSTLHIGVELTRSICGVLTLNDQSFGTVSANFCGYACGCCGTPPTLFSELSVPPEDESDASVPAEEPEESEPPPQPASVAATTVTANTIATNFFRISLPPLYWIKYGQLTPPWFIVFSRPFI